MSMLWEMLYVEQLTKLPNLRELRPENSIDGEACRIDGFERLSRYLRLVVGEIGQGHRFEFERLLFWMSFLQWDLRLA